MNEAAKALMRGIGGGSDRHDGDAIRLGRVGVIENSRIDGRGVGRGRCGRRSGGEGWEG